MSNIFGLTTNQLTEVFLQMTDICSFDDLRCSIISNGEAFIGYNAEKVILEFKVIRDGAIERFRCFTKKMNFGFSESQIYRNLNLAGAPIPKMYGVATTESGDEVIFLELLERVGINSKNEMEFELLLKTLAHFNSVDVSAVPPYEESQLRNQAFWLSKAWELAHAGKLGRNLAQVFDDLPRQEHKLNLYLEKIIKSLARVPVDTTHHDPANFNVGFNAGNLVLFDLHYVTAFPRFKDLALRVGASASPFPSSKSADYWIEVYLAYYKRFKKCRITLDDCKKEVETIKQAYKLYFDEQCLNEAVQAFNNNDEKNILGYSGWLAANYKYIISSV